MWDFRASALVLILWWCTLWKRSPMIPQWDLWQTPCLSVVHVICITWLQSGLHPNPAYIPKVPLQLYKAIKAHFFLCFANLVRGKALFSTIQRGRQDFLCLQQPHWPWQASWSYLCVVHRLSSSGNIGSIQNSQLCVNRWNRPAVKHE